MEAAELIKQCRYYHGEDKCPESLKALKHGELIWFYEMKWVQFLLQGDSLDWALDEYNAFGMSGFSLNDGVPISLKAILFNRYYHGEHIEFGGASFRQWYLQTYLQNLQY